jgi:mannose-6-phosphate isomerase-like protein (cupin superfamily)
VLTDIQLQQARLGIDPYLDWVEREGIPIHEGIFADLFSVETGDWPRYGAKGAAIHLRGRGDFCNMFVLELPAAGSTSPQRHLYEDVFYVLEGRGSTQLELADGRRRSFEWGPHSLFAIPLNAKHRHFNASGTQRALLCTTTSLPLMMKSVRSEAFIFDNDFPFEDRSGKDEYFTGAGDLTLIRPGQNVWETNFVPDLSTLELYAWSERGAGSSNIMFVLADGVMHAHISEIGVAAYKKAHRHRSGLHVLTVTGSGYSLLWFDGEPDFTRVDWKHGVVFPPIENQFHQHFATSNVPSRYVATGYGGIRYPFSELMRGSVFGNDGKSGRGQLSVKLGGDQIEYEDQDPRIHRIWLEEMRKHGITPRLEANVPV